jgi:hypothetical protein
MPASAVEGSAKTETPLGRQVRIHPATERRLN